MERPNHEPTQLSKRDCWARHLERQAASGLTQAAYCRREGIKVPSFQYWKRRLRSMGNGANQLRFVPIELTMSSSPDVQPVSDPDPTWIRLHFDGIVLEALETICPSRLEKLVVRLREGVRHVAN